MATPNVRKGNALFEFQHNMTKGQENVFALCLKALNEKMMAQPMDVNGNLIPLSQDEFYVDLDFHEVRDTMMDRYAEGRNEDFRKALKIMQKEAQIERKYERKDGKLDFESWQIIPHMRVSEVRNRIRFKFNWDLTEQYQDRSFFLYHLDDYLALDSKHSRRLYELFQRVYYRSDRNNVFGYIYKPYVEDLKEYLGIEPGGAYDKFGIFNRDILKKAIAEINKHTELIVRQNNVKRGRSVVWIEFDLKRNPDFRDEEIDNADQYDIFGGTTKVRDIPEPPEEYLEWRESIGGK